MADLRQQLRSLLQGRVCLVGVGNMERGDDAFGVLLARRLKYARAPRAAFGDSPNVPAKTLGWAEPAGALADPGCRDGTAPQIIVAGTVPERYLERLVSGGFDTVLFLDAVECGTAPGSVVLLSAAEMTTRFPQVSTHKLSLGLLAQLIETNGRTRVWLLGVQPASVRPGAGLSPAVGTVLECLVSLLARRAEEVLA